MSIHLEIKKIRDINAANATFIIPGYQRGYRWAQKEVERLLKDIPDVINSSGANNYCLQPVVVRKNSQGDYELIDGQQRLTTLYIIQKVISAHLNGFSKPKYSIDYTTRPGSSEHLKNIDKNHADPSTATCQDFWFMNEAAKVVEEWTKELADDDFYSLSLRINDQLEVIWYEVDHIGETEAIELFERLNIGKIPLTNSELVKALFLREASDKLSKDRAEEISLLWDQIEIQLNDSSFWGFLTANDKRQYETRIDLILDLLAPSHKGPGVDPLHTFFYFSDLLERNKNISEIWRDIYETYLTLLGWFQHRNHTVFHLISFLLASKLKTLKDIYRLQISQDGKKKGMREFTNELSNTIIDLLYDELAPDYIPSSSIGTISKKEKLNFIADLETLMSVSYDNDSDKPFIHHILLLYNILGENKADDSRRMFPIARHIDEKWTLEHIHARHSEMLKTNAQISNWLQTHIPLMKEKFSEESVILNMEQLLKELQSNPQTADTRQRYNDIYAKVWPLFNDGNEELHDLSNLTLLTQGQNSAVSNYVFEAKRRMVSDWDARGNYIPWGTRRVFFKNFHNADSRQIDFWSNQDRENYVKEISDTIKSLL